MQEEKQFVNAIADIEKNFPQWFTDVVIKTKLVDYGPVKGTMVMRPYGYAIWELIQQHMNKMFVETGHQNAYFPLFIPASFLNKEKEHVEGFAPEVAVVTMAGGEQLAEPLVVRPTSETIIGEMYAKWIQSYRDLPVLINQWANVVRWEKTTRPFLRTSEFLWQEGHTAHATEEEAMQETLQMLGIYKKFLEEYLAIPVFTGQKTEKEKFAGAVATFGVEAMMKDGKSLQSATSHYFGQNFAKAFDIQFLDADGKHKHVYTSSWGSSTRMIGALIMAHGDQRGLILPPRVAPIQAIIVPIMQKKQGVLEAVASLKAKLQNAGIRVESDQTDNTPGWKFNEWEMKGVPIRLELGPRDIEQNKVILFRRDTFEKIEVSLDEVVEKVTELLECIQRDLYQAALLRRQKKIVVANTEKELKDAVDSGNFVQAGWCGDRSCEEQIKANTSATARVMLDESNKNPVFSTTPHPAQSNTVCVCCGKKKKHTVLFAKAY